MPTARGTSGTKPVFTFPRTGPPTILQRQILSSGNGPVVHKGDFLTANYVEQIWAGKVVDNSYDRKRTETFQIGVGKVIPGWDTGLVGLQVGTRALLSVPPADGYGSAGSPGTGIKGTDTIVFVVDLVARIPWDATGQADAAPQSTPANLPKVTGAPGSEPTIKIARGLTEPTTNGAYLLYKGTGPPVRAGSLLCELVVTDWTQSQTQSTWPKPGSQPADSSKGLQRLEVQSDGPLKTLISLPVGSRVLVVIAATTDAAGTTTPLAVAVVDIVAQI